MLALASSALILPGLSEGAPGSGPAEVKVELKPEVLVSFRKVVEDKVLGHLNAKLSIFDRFSRVKRPMPIQYYECEVVGIDDEGVVAFRLVRWDRSKPGKPARDVISTGTCNHVTGEVLLKTAPERGSVPASRHPLLVRKPNT